MIIGTPLSSNATKVMLLGSGELGKEVIIALQRLGVEVIAVDRYPNAPGHQVAHRAHVIDMTDGKALKSLVEQERPHLIVPEIEAIATDMLLEIEQQGLAQVIPTARATQLTMNREGIRSLAAETLGLATSNYAFADNLKDVKTAAQKIGYPCIIKPTMSSSGKGQSLVENEHAMSDAWDYALDGGRVKQNRVIIEEKIEFDYEITLLTVRTFAENGDIETYFCDPIGHIQKAGDYVESWQPQPMSQTALKSAQEMAKTVTTQLGGRGIFGVEFFVKGDKVWFSEVSPRPHDTGMVTMVSQRQSEFALHARAILGLPVDTQLLTPGASAVIYGTTPTKTMSFHQLDQALRTKNTEIRLFGKPESFSKRRMGVALSYEENITQARTLANTAANLVVTEAT
ncbi:MAG: formate-dependent phosphoribosylglycinamide formyltransferase [Methylococcales bacterium]|jgi:phosphoribosylglycinamide formyltransferase 2|nr:formate-dependent phosphoribosylglycinamide formyltransferase [Methylococcales bacterium]MBT7445402.1 formate-dependent phosphoribosylglycinamide formyltransferase [Methylococcales bacterium]